MNLDLSQVKDTLIICPNNYKEKLLESFNNEKKIVDVKFYTLEEYKKNYLFNYDIRTIKYLYEKGLSIENSKEILNNLYYVEDKEYGNRKLDKLVEYRKTLDKEGILIYNPLFKSFLETKNIVVYGYGKLNNHDLSLIKGKTVKVIEENYIDKKYKINIFDEIEQEVEFVYNSIYDLLNKGININNIYVANANSDYDAYFKRFNKYYGFNIEENDNFKLIGTKIADDFIKMLDENTKEEIYEFLSNNENDISKKLLSILNKYVEFDLSEIKEFIINDIKNTSYKKEYTNIVKRIKTNEYINSNDYVFFVGFNDTTPAMERDTDYITDNIKHLVNLPTTEEKNELRKQNLKSCISNIENIVLTYSKNSPFNSYNKQVILDEDKCEYIQIKNSLSYSDELNKAKYIDNLDLLRKFNFKNKDIEKQYATYDKNNYLSYNNRFKGLNDKQLKTIPKQINYKNNNDITLSYSSMNNFFECKFKYYLDTVLKVKESFGNYYTKLGTVCHGVLQDLYREDKFDFETSWNNQIKKEEEKENASIFEDESEKYFVGKIKNELKQDVEIVKKQKENSLLTKQMCEQEFTFNVSDNINFTGFIDKIMFKETNDEILASVIDYKTSRSIEIDKDIMKYGLSLQLPSYLYLMKHSEKFNKEIKIAGLYIQHIINFDRKYRNEEHSLEITKAESMRLDGISSIVEDRLMANDLSLAPGKKSETIKNISMNKDGSLKKSDKLYTDEQFEELSNTVENNIKSAGEAILKGDFAINPKEIDGKNMSCSYCKYAPICYKRPSDLVYIDTQKEEQ